MTAKNYIEHRPTGQSINLQKTNIDSFTIRKSEFSFYDVLVSLVEQKSPYVAPIQKELEEFSKALVKYKQILPKHGYQDNEYAEVVVPRNLVKDIDPEDATFSLFTDIDKFSDFYNQSIDISDKWKSIQNFLNDKKRKKEIADNLSANFIAWETKRYHIDEKTSFGKSSKLWQISESEKDHWSGTDNFQDGYHKKIAAYVAKQQYQYCSFSLGVAVHIGFFNVYDAMYTLAAKNPFSKILSSDVFTKPLSEFGLKKAPVLKIPAQLSLYAVAVRDPERIPQDTWLKRTGHGLAIFTSFCEELSEATSFTSLASAQEAAKDVSVYETSIIEFKSQAVRAIPSVASQVNLASMLTSQIEEEKLTRELGDILAPSDTSTEVIKPKRHKI